MTSINTAEKATIIRVDSSIPEESQLEDNGIPMTDQVSSILPSRRAPTKRNDPSLQLSLTSRKYDIDGDGKLDDAEKAMRDMDTEGHGTLANVEVYKIVKESMNTQRELFKLKRVVVALVGFAFLLTLSNLGTSVAAAFLAKDTTTTNNNLVDTTTKETVATQTAADDFRVSATADIEGRRMLDKDFEISSLVLKHNQGATLIDKCERGKTVTLTRTFQNTENAAVTTNICPAWRVNTNQKKGGSAYKDAVITKEDGARTRLVSDGTEYRIMGDNMLQGVDEPCDSRLDCDNGLICEGFICREPLLPRECPQNDCHYFFKQGAAWGEGTSRDDPINSISVALGLLKPGNTLHVMGLMTNPSYNPTYEYEDDLEDPHLWHQENTLMINKLHGEPNNYITITSDTSEDGEPAILRGDGANILRVMDSSYLRILGFEIYGQVEEIPLSTATALQFVYKDEDGQVQYRVDPTLTPEEVGELTLDKLGDVSRASYTDTRGAYFSDCDHLVIEANTIHHTPGGGLRVSYSEHVDIIGNEIHDCSRRSYSGTHALIVTYTFDKLSPEQEKGEYRVRIMRNLVHHNYNEIYSWAPTKTAIEPKIDEGKGISLQRNQKFKNGGRILVANNIAYWNGYSGIHSNDGDNIDFIGNTAYMNSYTGSIMDGGGEDVEGRNIGISMAGGRGNVIANNIAFIDTSWGGFPISVTEKDVTVHNNLVYGEGMDLLYNFNLPDDTESDAYPDVGDPLFLRTLSHDEYEETFDLRVSAESPAVNYANADVSFMLETDYYGNIRDSTSPTIGAAEYII